MGRTADHPIGHVINCPERERERQKSRLLTLIDINFIGYKWLLFFSLSPRLLGLLNYCVVAERLVQ